MADRAATNVCSSCFKACEDIICLACRLQLRQSAMLQTLMEAMPLGSAPNAWQKLTQAEQLDLLRQHSLNPKDDNDDDEDDNNDNDYDEEFIKRSMSNIDNEKLAFFRKYFADNNILPEVSSLSASEEIVNENEDLSSTDLLTEKNAKLPNAPIDWLANTRPTAKNAVSETKLPSTVAESITKGMAENMTADHERAATSSMNATSTVVTSLTRAGRTSETSVQVVEGTTTKSDVIEKPQVDTITGREQRPSLAAMRLPAKSSVGYDSNDIKSNTLRFFSDAENQIMPEIDFIPESKPLQTRDDSHPLRSFVATGATGGGNGRCVEPTLRQLSVLQLMTPVDDEEIRSFPDRIVNGVRQISTANRNMDNHQRTYPTVSEGRTKMWKGYYGNVYFEPIMIERVASKLSTSGRRGDRSAVAATEQDGQLLNDLAAPRDPSSAPALFRLNEHFYQQLPDSLRSSPPWVWKTVGNCRRNVSINTPPISAANRRVQIASTSSAGAPTLTPRLVPSTALARNSLKNQPSTQRERFNSAAAKRTRTVTAAASGRQLEGISNTISGTTGLVDSFPIYRPTPPETSPDQRRREQPFDKKRIRRGRSLSIGRTVDSPRQSVVVVGGDRKGSLDGSRKTPDMTTTAITGAKSTCLVTASASGFRRTAPCR